MIRRTAPETLPRERPKRCCAKCRTPYNCGNPDCRCHPLTVDRLIEIAAKAAEQR